jgi:hypothetical protein
MNVCVPFVDVLPSCSHVSTISLAAPDPRRSKGLLQIRRSAYTRRPSLVVQQPSSSDSATPIPMQVGAPRWPTPAYEIKRTCRRWQRVLWSAVCRDLGRDAKKRTALGVKPSSLSDLPNSDRSYVRFGKRVEMPTLSTVKASDSDASHSATSVRVEVEGSVLVKGAPPVGSRACRGLSGACQHLLDKGRRAAESLRTCSRVSG